MPRPEPIYTATPGHVLQCRENTSPIEGDKNDDWQFGNFLIEA